MYSSQCSPTKLYIGRTHDRLFSFQDFRSKSFSVSNPLLFIVKILIFNCVICLLSAK